MSIFFTMMMMAGDEGNPIFHDFLGTTCSASPPLTLDVPPLPSASVAASHPLPSPTSDLASGRKRSNSDQALVNPGRDGVHYTRPDSLESIRLLKMPQHEAVEERRRRSHADESAIIAQQLRPNTTNPVTLQSPSSSRSELGISSWDRSLPFMGVVMHHPSRLGQFTTYADNLSSDKFKDASAATSIITEPAADEGSRTGIKGSSLLNITSTCSGAPERIPTGVLLSSSRPKTGFQNEMRSSNAAASCQKLVSNSRQMTIFYAGHAHVFDDVHPSKADAIMALAGSGGGSWSTTYSSSSKMRPSVGEAFVPSGKKDMGVKNTISSQDFHGQPSVAQTSNGSSQGVWTSIPGGFQSVRHVRDSRTVAQSADLEYGR